MASVTCPYAEKCIFLHEDAQKCKYGMQCERLLCMFKHECNLDNILAEENVEDVVTVDESSESIVDNEEMINHDNVNFNCTFNNPSQVNKIANYQMFKCDKCDYAPASKGEISDHKELNHNWCSKCFSNFNNQENLQNHIKTKHSKKKRKKAERAQIVGEAPR